MNNRAGIILRYREIEHHPSIPARLRTVQTDVADVSRHYTWANNTVCGGSAFDSFLTARNAAIGEAVERYCGNCTPSSNFIKASYNDITRNGERALDPEHLILYSEKQYNSSGFPFVRFTRELKVCWLQGRSLTKDEPIWIPASLVYVNWYAGKYVDEPPTNYPYYPGIASGPSLDFALASAVEEIIERDATMIWWMNRHPLPTVITDASLSSLWEGPPTELGQRAWIVSLDNEFGVPVMAGIVENTKEQLFNIGFAARPTPEQAALKAWTEALTLQEGSRDLLEPNGLLRQMIEFGDFHGDALKLCRSDRAYLDDYQADFRDVSDLMCQQQVFLDPRARKIVRSWTDTKATLLLDSLSKLPDRSIATYRKLVEQRGYEVLYVDITSFDVACSGLKVVRVVIPGLVPNFPAAFPFLGNGRIQNAPVDLGWRTTPLTEDELNYFPLPHA